MALPWLGILDTAIDMATMALARRARKRADGDDQRQLVAGGANPGVPATLETHLAGVVVAALKEVFERDTRRLDLEREQAEAERARAERALRLELLRQAADREIGRLRLMAGVALASWLGTMVLAPRLAGGSVAGRVALGSGWLFLLAALACAFAGLSRVSRALVDADLGRDPALRVGPAGTLAAWFIIAGLGLLGAAMLLA
jgi:hypothetical protein